MNAPLDRKLRLDWLQVLRGIAALMVVFFHLWLWERKSLGTFAITPSFFTSGESGVDVFFIISGFIMVFITPRAFRGISDWSSFLYRRFTRIFPPFWIISLLLLLLWLRHPELFNNYQHNQIDLVRSFLLLPQRFLPLEGVGWSLIHEVYFYVMVSLIFFGRRSNRMIWVSIWFLVLLAVNGMGSAVLFSGSPVRQLIFSPFSMEFQLGMTVAFTWQWVMSRRLSPFLCTILAGCSLLALYVSGCFIPPGGVYPDNNHLFRVIYYGLPAFFLVASVVQLDASGRFKAPAWAVLVGDASYAIYLLHVPIINALYKIFAKLDPHPDFMAALCAFIIIAAITLLVAIAFHVFAERRLISCFHKYSPFDRVKS